MSTGLTFGTISALFGLTDGIINQTQYTILVTVVILSAVVPTLIAQTWFRPDDRLLEEHELETRTFMQAGGAVGSRYGAGTFSGA